MADARLTRKALSAAEEAFGAPLVAAELLRGGGARAVLQRAIGPNGTCVVIKCFHERGEEWAREAAALQILPPAVPAPRLLAASVDPPLVVMSDLGNGPSVADALLGADPLAATGALETWATAMAGLHAATVNLGDDFARALASRAPAVQPSRMPRVLDTAAHDLQLRMDELGVPIPAGALDRLRTLLSGDDPRTSALTPADACPDNNLRVGGGLALLDFEGAEYRHIAWDAAYLLVPWPSCWCCWQMPASVAEHALTLYRTSLAPLVPYAASGQFGADLVRARIGWALVSTSWFAANALGDDPASDDPRIVAPSRRAMILHRLAVAADENAHEVEPLLAALAAALRSELVRRWGEIPLGNAPAFR